MIAVTGANGLLGSYIVRRLLHEKRDVVALKRATSDTSLLTDVASSIRWINADVTNPVQLEDAFNHVSVVIHAAAIVSFNPRLAKKMFEVNVTGTRNVVNACLTAGVKKLIHISSVAALGRLKGDTHIDENHKWIDNPMNTTYAETKYLAELEVFRGHEEGLNSVLVNPSVILAAADWAKSSAKLFKYVWDERKFYTDKNMNFVDARDVAEAVVKLVDINAPGERFILNATNLDLKEFFKKVATQFNKKAPSVKVNQFMLELISRVEAVRSWVSKSEPLITRETARMAGSNFVYSNKKVRKQLNFEFQSIDDTIKWCCEYYIARANAKK
ncbi:MAG TPA: SDR family NAD(P)-dependent oxidoreductase [Chryseosolibacter sp.]